MALFLAVDEKSTGTSMFFIMWGLLNAGIF
jgi:hypothetical protein